MDSGTIIIILGVIGVILICSAVVICATISNNKQNVETLEEANARLMEMRKEYQANKAQLNNEHS